MEMVIVMGCRWDSPPPDSLQKVIHNLIHSLWTDGNAVGSGAEAVPPVLKSQRGGLYTPQKNIFPKVKVALTSGYTVCVTNHIGKSEK